MKAYPINKYYKPYSRITLFEGDCLKLLKSLKSKSVQLIITSPPYNIGKKYEKKEEIDIYLKNQEKIIEECQRVLKKDGSICWQTGNHILGKNGQKKHIIPLDILFYPLFKNLGFQLRNRIVWKFGHGFHSQYRLSGRYEVVCWYTLSDNYVFNLNSIRVKQKYRGKRAYQGKNKGLPSGNPLGKNPSDYWDNLHLDDYEKELMWDLWQNVPNIKSHHIEKTEHPCQYPVTLVRRLVKMLSNRNHLILDPFVGTGTTLIGGLLEGRRVVGADTKSEYINISRNRLKDLFKGKLKIREDKQIFKPSGREQVAREPNEWLK